MSSAGETAQVRSVCIGLRDQRREWFTQERRLNTQHAGLPVRAKIEMPCFTHVVGTGYSRQRREFVFTKGHKGSVGQVRIAALRRCGTVANPAIQVHDHRPPKIPDGQG